MAVQARQPPAAGRAALESGDRRLEAGHASPTPGTSATTADAVVPRRRRLVPQGLPAARAPPSGCRGSCASSRSTTARRSGSTASRSARTAAPTCRSRSACRPGCSSAAASTTWSSASTTRRKPTDFPPSGLSIDGRADRRLVELRRPAARGLPAQDRRRRLQHGRRPARPAVRARATATVTYRATLRNYGTSARRVARQRALRRARASRSARATIGAKRFATLHQAASGSTSPRLWSPASPYLYDASLAVRSGGDDAAALHAEDRHPLDQGRRRPPVPQRRADELPRRRRCTRTRTTMGFAIDNATARPAARVGQGARRDASSARTTRCTPTLRSAPTSWGSCSGRRSRSTRSRRSTSSSSSCASSRRASSSRTSTPTATTRR